MMKKSTIILILAVMVVYLFYKNRASIGGKKYKVISDMDLGGGYIHDQSGEAVSIVSLSPQAGDIVEGDIIETFIHNQNVRGLSIDVSLGPNIENQTKIFIPEENLQLL